MNETILLSAIPVILNAASGEITTRGRLSVQGRAKGETFYLAAQLITTQRIIISGGVYKKSHIDDKRYYYQFIDGAIAQIKVASRSFYKHMHIPIFL